MNNIKIIEAFHDVQYKNWSMNCVPLLLLLLLFDATFSLFGKQYKQTNKITTQRLIIEERALAIRFLLWIYVIRLVCVISLFASCARFVLAHCSSIKYIWEHKHMTYILLVFINDVHNFIPAEICHVPRSCYEWENQHNIELSSKLKCHNVYWIGWLDGLKLIGLVY